MWTFDEEQDVDHNHLHQMVATSVTSGTLASTIKIHYFLQMMLIHQDVGKLCCAKNQKGAGHNLLGMLIQS